MRGPWAPTLTAWQVFPSARHAISGVGHRSDVAADLVGGAGIRLRLACLFVELENGFPEGQEFGDLGIEFPEALPEQALDVRARCLAVLADLQDLADLGEGEPGG